MRIRDPLPHRRTRHLTDFRRECQGAGWPIPACWRDVRWKPPQTTPKRRCTIVHNDRWVTLWVFPVTYWRYPCRSSPCFRWIIGFREPLRGGPSVPVVHTNPLIFHNLSTGLSFVDNLERGVQSGSKHYTGRVAHAQPGTACLGIPRCIPMEPPLRCPACVDGVLPFASEK